MAEPHRADAPERSAAAATAAALRAAAARSTTVGIQRAVARLLGASPEVADAAAAAAGEADLLRHGIALPALVAASRRGTDVAGGLALIARGERLPTSWSDYEARAAREEAVDEAAQILRRLPSGTMAIDLLDRGAPAAGAHAMLAGAGRATLGAVAAHRRSGVDLLQAVIEERWMRLVLSAAGLPIAAAPLPDPADRDLQSALDTSEDGADGPPTPAAAVPADAASIDQSAVIRRSPDYLDPFESAAGTAPD